MKLLTFAIIVVAILIVATQIITEVIKLMIKDKNKYNLVCCIVSFALTVSTVIAICQVKNYPLAWYIIIGAMFGSFFIAYGAMLGYDKLVNKVFTAIKQAFTTINEIEKE